MIKLIRSKLAKKQSQEIEDDVADQVNCQLIHGDCLKVIRDIGDGQYGFVKLGKWTQNNGKKRFVAIKCMKDAATQLITEIVKEASIMQTLQHENILIFHGISFPMDGQPQLRLIIEFSPLGSLHGNLRKDTSGVRQVSTLNRFAVQIASGMQYLASRKLVHRDLATRNILVFQNEMVKICDFGLARAMGNAGVLELTIGRRMPFAWCSPEILSKSLYSLASDVWSYGVTLWEMYSFGEAPWESLDIREVLKVVTTSPLRRLERPRACPDSIYEVMMRCWEYEPEKRPSFQEIYKSVAELHPKQMLTKTFHRSTNEDLLDYEEKDTITVISSSNKESQAGLWLGQHTNGQIGLFEKKNVKLLKGNKRNKKRAKSLDTELPHSPSGLVRYGLPAHEQEERDEEEEEEEEEIGRPNFNEPPLYMPMNRERSETEERVVHDHDDYVSIHNDAALHHGGSVPTPFTFPRQQRTTPADDISIPEISSGLDINGASQSVPTFHAFPSEPEQRTISADDVSTTGAPLGSENEASQPPSWVTLPRNQKPPRIPERVDLTMGRKVPNVEGAWNALRGGATAEARNAKRKTPVPTPRKKSGCSEANSRPQVKPQPTQGEGTSYQNEPTVAPLASEKQDPQGAPLSKMGLSNGRVSPMGAEDDPSFSRQKGPSEGDEEIYERPWLDISKPIYDVPKQSGTLTNGSQHIYDQPKRSHVGAEWSGEHLYNLPDPVDPGEGEHIYERADLLLGKLEQSTRPQSDTVGQGQSSPPLPQKDIISRETSRLPEPLRPVPLSPTSPTTSASFSFTLGTHSAMMSSVTSVMTAVPLVLPPPPEIPEETLHQPPPDNAFGDSPFFEDLESSVSGMTLDFRKSHSVHAKLPSEGEEMQVGAARQGNNKDGDSAPGEEGKYFIEQVRAVWPGAVGDWCCAAFMECDGDLTEILQIAKVEQVHSITRREKERCESTLQHCNWDVDRTVNWLLDEG